MITPDKACPGCCTVAEQGKPWSCWPRARASGWEMPADPFIAADVTSLCIPLVSSEAGYGLTFQQPQKAGDCSKKKALKWRFSASVIVSSMGMTTGMNWRFRGETDLPGQATYPNAAHCPWQVGFHLQSEAAVRRDQPLLPLAKTGLQSFPAPGSLRPSFSKVLILQLMQAAAQCHTGIMCVFMVPVEWES